MSERSHRIGISGSQADLARRAIGAVLRPRKSVRELAEQCGADYDELRDFLRKRRSSFKTEQERDCIMRCASQCCELLGLSDLAAAKNLPPYSPRRSRQNSEGSEVPLRLTLQLQKLLKSIPEKSLSHASSILGTYTCYRILADRVVRSKLFMFRRQDANWLEFAERWQRVGKVIEYDGYILPTESFLYFFGLHHRNGVPRTMVAHVLTSGTRVEIIGLVTGHSPAAGGGVTSGHIVMQKESGNFRTSIDFRNRANLEDTGDISLGDVPPSLLKSLKDLSDKPALVSIQVIDVSG
ncbi:MAG TPA: hypothetical protein VMT54_16180 [Candidatus Cybelea sp.]|nr:hypothetical protein [Candidatus Cybelea sp.]